MAELDLQQRGSAWYVRSDEWRGIVLVARNSYVGTDRVLVTATLAREDCQPAQSILTERLNLLTSVQTKRFARTATDRLQESADGAPARIERSIESMLDGLQERLLATHDELLELAADEIELPASLAPAYAVWPFVPVARAGLLIGPRGQGKSTMVQAAGLSVVTGQRVLPGCEPRVQGPVLYVGQEEDPEQWGKRLEMICRGLGIARPHGYRYVQLPSSSLIASADALAERVAIRGAALVIIDSAQATWGDGTEAGVREYATRWFHAVKRLGVPAWVVEHPNRFDTRNGHDLEAAGTSVKGDRAGHQWTLESVELPLLGNGEARYHVTLQDTKRSYVAKQPDFTFVTRFHEHEWVRFEEASALTAETIIESTRLFRDIVATMRQNAPHEEGWTLAELTKALGQKSDGRIRTELSTSDMWRVSQGGYAERIVRAHEGSRGRGRATRYILETRMPELPAAPGDEGVVQ